MKIKKLLEILKQYDEKSDVNFVLRGKTPEEDTWINSIQDIHEYKEDEGTWIVVDITKPLIGE